MNINTWQFLMNSFSLLELNLTSIGTLVILSDSILAFAVACDQFLDYLTITNFRCICKFYELLIRIVKLKGLEEIIKEVTKWNFCLLSEFTSNNVLIFRENFSIHAFINIFFGIYFITQPEKTLYRLENI